MREPNPLLSSISDWFRRNFSDPATVALFFTVLFMLLFLEFFGHFFMPVLISIVLTYLLLSVVRLLERCRFPHFLAVLVVFSVFIGLVIFAIVWILPIVVRQLQNLANELPTAFSQGHQWMTTLMQKYPVIFADPHFQQSILFLQNEMSNVGQLALKHVWILIPNLITVVLYFILVPLLLFFFLKDSHKIVHWFTKFLPKNRSLVMNVWQDVNQKIGCYVRGRVIEVLIVGSMSSIAFALLGMEYAMLMGMLVGLSVIIPYIGVVLVTIPIFIIALMQWGIAPHFLYLMITYAVIILIDANVIIPLLFSETMDLHPVVIILSVLVFGGIWGFWGVFFAIPLATVGDVILRNWPREGGDI